MYAEDQILVRDEFLERVLEIIEPDTVFREARDDPERVHRIIAGVVRLRLRAEHRSVPDLLDDVDRQLGAGAATPDHVLTVAGGHGGVCPATEPRPVDFGTEPYPSVCPGRGGEGVLIYMDEPGCWRDRNSRRETHPWLAHGVRMGDPAEDCDPRDPTPGNPPSIPAYTGHGTFVAGVTRCMAPAAEIIVTNVFRSRAACWKRNWCRGSKQRSARRGHLPLTIAAHSRRDLPLVAFLEWLRHVREHTSAVCVVAAGNDGSPRRAWPAAMPGVISVGALGGDWRGRAPFSNYGAWVDVYAPGRDLINAYATGTYECQWFPYKGRAEPRIPAVLRHGQVERHVVLDTDRDRAHRGPDVPHRRKRPARGRGPARRGPGAGDPGRGCGPAALLRFPAERPMRCGGCGGCGCCTQHHRC